MKYSKFTQAKQDVTKHLRKNMHGVSKDAQTTLVLPLLTLQRRTVLLHIASAICAAKLNNCWVGAKQWQNGATSTDFFWFSIPFNDVKPFRVEHRFIDDKCFTKTNLGRCLHTNDNGNGFCHDDCAAKKCYVCELHQKYDY